METSQLFRLPTVEWRKVLQFEHVISTEDDVGVQIVWRQRTKELSASLTGREDVQLPFLISPHRDKSLDSGLAFHHEIAQRTLLRADTEIASDTRTGEYLVIKGNDRATHVANVEIDESLRIQGRRSFTNELFVRNARHRPNVTNPRERRLGAR